MLLPTERMDAQIPPLCTTIVYNWHPLSHISDTSARLPWYTIASCHCTHATIAHHGHNKHTDTRKTMKPLTERSEAEWYITEDNRTNMADLLPHILPLVEPPVPHIHMDPLKSRQALVYPQMWGVQGEVLVLPLV